MTSPQGRSQKFSTAEPNRFENHSEGQLSIKLLQRWEGSYRDRCTAGGHTPKSQVQC